MAVDGDRTRPTTVVLWGASVPVNVIFPNISEHCHGSHGIAKETGVNEVIGTHAELRGFRAEHSHSIANRLEAVEGIRVSSTTRQCRVDLESDKIVVEGNV